MSTTLTPIKERLEGLRGGAYYDVWADFWKGECQHIRNEVKAQRATGEFTPRHLVIICDRYALPWKPFITSLEKDRLVPTCLYEKLPPIGKLRAVVYAESEGGA